MAVSDWLRYERLLREISELNELQGDYFQFEQAVDAREDGKLWGRDGSDFSGAGLDALFEEMGEGNESARMARLRNAVAARPAAEVAGYEQWAGYYLREDPGLGWVYADTRDALEWSPVDETDDYDETGDPESEATDIAGAEHDADDDADTTSDPDEIEFTSDPADAGPRYFDMRLANYYDEAIGWLPVTGLPAGQRAPRDGDVFLDGNNWVPVTAAQIEQAEAAADEPEPVAANEAAEGAAPADRAQRFYDHALGRYWDQDARQYVESTDGDRPRAGVDRRFLPDGSSSEPVTEEMIAAAFTRYFSVGLTRRYNAITGVWGPPGGAAPAVGDMRSASVAEPETFIPITAEMLAETEQQRQDLKADAKEIAREAIQNGEVRVTLAGPGMGMMGRRLTLSQAELSDRLAGAGIPVAALFGELGEQAMAEGKGTGHTMIDADGLNVGLALENEITMIDAIGEDGADRTAYQARVRWSFIASLEEGALTAWNAQVLGGLPVGDTVPITQVGAVVVLAPATHPQAQFLNRLLNAFVALGGDARQEHQVRRTTHLRKPVLRTDAGEQVLAALRAAGWTNGITPEKAEQRA